MNPYTCHCRVWIITDMQKGNWPVNTVVVVLFFLHQARYLYLFYYHNYIVCVHVHFCYVHGLTVHAAWYKD